MTGGASSETFSTTESQSTHWTSAETPAGTPNAETQPARESAHEQN